MVYRVTATRETILGLQSSMSETLCCCDVPLLTTKPEELMDPDCKYGGMMAR